MANLSLFHRPSLILLICLPFVEAHSQLPEFRIRSCFVTKTARVIMLNRWTKGWPTNGCAREFASMCVYGYQVHTAFPWRKWIWIQCRLEIPYFCISVGADAKWWPAVVWQMLLVTLMWGSSQRKWRYFYLKLKQQNINKYSPGRISHHKWPRSFWISKPEEAACEACSLLPLI